MLGVYRFLRLSRVSLLFITKDCANNGLLFIVHHTFWEDGPIEWSTGSCPRYNLVESAFPLRFVPF